MIQINPFSSRFITPGVREFVFADEDQHQPLVDEFRSRKKAQIVGTHGSGKTTLGIQLAQTLELTLKQFVIRETSEAATIAMQIVEAMQSSDESDMVLVDGIERLPSSKFRKILETAKLSNAYFLITVHQVVDGLPVLYSTQSQYRVFCQIANSMVGPEIEIPEDVLSSVYQTHQPNIREALFGLYDWFETRLA